MNYIGVTNILHRYYLLIRALRRINNKQPEPAYRQAGNHDTHTTKVFINQVFCLLKKY